MPRIRVLQVAKNFEGGDLILPDGRPATFRIVAGHSLLNPLKSDPMDGAVTALALFRLAHKIWADESPDLTQPELETILARVADNGAFNYLVVGRIGEMIEDAKRREVIHAVAVQAEATPEPAAPEHSPGDHDRRRSKGT